MIKSPTRRGVFLGTLLLASLASLCPAASWPVSAEGLASDPAWTWGVLDNGLRYVVRRNAVPPGHISFRLAVEVGFAHEQKGERGFAHFVEHMAFNGTTHFPGETLVPELEKHGVGIGPELSAFTFLTHTLYYLDAPSVAPGDLDRWFTVLRDFADGLQFDRSQVRRERGVIASEARDRESAGTRAEGARRRFLYPVSPLANPFNGGVENPDRAALRKFYEKWYRPERMILAVVGDVESAQLETLVRRHFASLRPRALPAPVFDPGDIMNPASTAASVYHDPKAGGLSVEVTSILPHTEADGPADRRRWFARNLALYVLNVRLGEIARAHPKTFYQLGARSMFSTPFSLETLISFSSPPPDWKSAMGTIEKELRRSFIYTFTGDELREARAAILASHELRVKSSATEPSVSLAGNVVQQALWGFVASSPRDDLKRALEELPQIDALEVNRAWRALWQERRAQVFASGFFPPAYGHTLLLDAFNQSLRESIEPPEAKKDPVFAYTDFGEPGKIKYREYLPELDIHLLEFENGVRVNLKRTPFEAATIHLVGRLGNGLMSEPLDQPGLGAMVTGSFLNGALGRHSPPELRRILSSAQLALSFATQEDSFELAGRATPTSVDLLLRVIAAYLTDPAWDPESAALAAAQLSTYSHDLDYTPEGILTRRAFRFLTRDDQRYAPPSVPEVQARTVDEMKQWLAPSLRSAPIELGLVGDFDPEQVIALLARTLGALPPRDAINRRVRLVSLAKTAFARHFVFQGEANREGLEVVWPLDQCDNVRTSRQFEVLRAIFEDELRQQIREDLGAAYTPSVGYWKSEASPADGYLTAYLTVKPGTAARMTKRVIEIADQLSRKGVSAEEFARGREPLLARSIADQKENGYWVRNIIGKIQSQPDIRHWPMSRIPDLQTMTPAEINTLARLALPAAKAFVFTATPARP